MTTRSSGRLRDVRHLATASVLRRPAMLSATAVAALSVLLAPLPAHAAPTPVGVPDSGSRPAPIGALRMPGFWLFLKLTGGPREHHLDAVLGR